MSPDNNFASVDFGYSFGNEQSLEFGTQYNVLDSGTSIFIPSTFQDWYLNPPTEGYANRGYQGSTSLDASGIKPADPNTLPPVRTYDGPYTGGWGWF